MMPSDLIPVFRKMKTFRVSNGPLGGALQTYGDENSGQFQL